MRPEIHLFCALIAIAVTATASEDKQERSSEQRRASQLKENAVKTEEYLAFYATTNEPGYIAKNSDAAVASVSSEENASRSDSSAENSIRRRNSWIFPIFYRSNGTIRMIAPDSTASQTVFMVCCVTLSALIVCGNLIVIVVFLKVKKLRNGQAIYKISLAFCDLIAGAFVFPSIVTTWTSDELNEVHIKARAFLTTVTTTVSITTLLFAGWDRIYAIGFPLRYKTSGAAKIAPRLSVALWIFSAVVSSFPLYITSESYIIDPSYLIVIMDFRVASPFSLLSSVVLMCINGVVVYILVRIQSKNPALLSTPASARLRRERKLAVTLCVMTFAFVVSVLPRTVVRLTRPTEYECLPLIAAAVFMFMTNSLWNCFVYSFRNKTFRDETKNIFQTWLKQICQK